MSETNRTVTEAELHAFADGLLPGFVLRLVPCTKRSAVPAITIAAATAGMSFEPDAADMRLIRPIANPAGAAIRIAARVAAKPVGAASTERS